MSRVALVGRFACESMMLCVFVGCVGTETGNPSETRDVSMAMVLKSSNPAIVTCGSETEGGGTALNVQSAWLATNYLHVDGCLGSDESDLSAGAWNLLQPVARHFQTGIPTYCGFDFQTQPADSTLGNIPAQLSGSSVWISATRSDQIPVDIRTPVILDVMKPNSSGPNANTKLVIALDAAAWLAGIDFNGLNPGADGVVHLAPTVNAPVLQVFEQQTSADILLRTESSDDGVTDN